MDVEFNLDTKTISVSGVGRFDLVGLFNALKSASTNYDVTKIPWLIRHNGIIYMDNGWKLSDDSLKLLSNMQLDLVVASPKAEDAYKMASEAYKVLFSSATQADVGGWMFDVNKDEKGIWTSYTEDS